MCAVTLITLIMFPCHCVGCALLPSCMIFLVLKSLVLEDLIDLCGIMLDPAVLAVSNVLMPDGSVQTTSQLTFSRVVSDIANGPALQTFMRGHLALHMESVQQHGALPRSSLHTDRSSRPINNSPAVHRSSRHHPWRRPRTPPAPRFRLRSVTATTQ